MFWIEYQDYSKAYILCDKYRYYFMDALNIAENVSETKWMEKAVIGWKWETCLIYLDGIIIEEKMSKDILQNCRTVFDRLLV